MLYWMGLHDLLRFKTTNSRRDPHWGVFKIVQAGKIDDKEKVITSRLLVDGYQSGSLYKSQRAARELLLKGGRVGTGCCAGTGCESLLCEEGNGLVRSSLIGLMLPHKKPVHEHIVDHRSDGDMVEFNRDWQRRFSGRRAVNAAEAWGDVPIDLIDRLFAKSLAEYNVAAFDKHG